MYSSCLGSRQCMAMDESVMVVSPKRPNGILVTTYKLQDSPNDERRAGAGAAAACEFRERSRRRTALQQGTRFETGLAKIEPIGPGTVYYTYGFTVYTCLVGCLSCLTLYSITHRKLSALHRCLCGKQSNLRIIPYSCIASLTVIRFVRPLQLELHADCLYPRRDLQRRQPRSWRIGCDV